MKRRKTNNYSTMRRSNVIAKTWLIINGYNHIQLFGHTRHGMSYTRKNEDTTFTHDLWGIADGICLSEGDKEIYLIQIKTNAWPNEKELREFTSKWSVNILALNVVGKRVMVREYFAGEVINKTPDIRKYK